MTDKKIKHDKKIEYPATSRYLAAMTLEEDKAIRAAATSVGLPKSTFVRQVALQEASKLGFWDLT